METAEQYLRLRIISKGGYVENGKVVGETLSGRDNVMREINWIAPLMEDYAKKKIEDFKRKNGLPE